MGADKPKVESHTVFSAVVLAVFGLLGWLMFYDIGYSSGRHEERAHIERQHYSADSANRLRNCEPLRGADFRKCAYDAIDSERESQREESDLAAQWQAADWAKWAVIIAGAQLIVTMIGLYFLKGTLDATWRAVTDTGRATNAMLVSNNIALDTNRPWIDISVVVKSLEATDTGILISYSVIFKNIGRSIANSIWTYVDTDFYGDDLAGMRSLRESWWFTAKGPSSRSFMPGEQFEHIADIHRSKQFLPWVGKDRRHVQALVVASAHYNLPGEPGYENRRRTDRAFRMGFAPDGNKFRAFWIFEEDLRKAGPDEVGVWKLGSSTTT